MPETHHDQLYDPAAAGSIGQSEHIGGPRKYEGQGLGPVVSWNCPACGKPNSRPLSEGCEFCHSGEGAAKHVGVDPIVRKGTKPAVGEISHDITEDVHLLLPALHAGETEAFVTWVSLQARRPTAEQTGALWRAFHAGWQAAMQQQPDHAPIAQTESSAPDAQVGEGSNSSGGTTPTEPLEGTPESRTIVAALQLFKAQVLDEGPEEVGTGEWLLPEEIDDLIADVKRKYA